MTTPEPGMEHVHIEMQYSNSISVFYSMTKISSALDVTLTQNQSSVYIVIHYYNVVKATPVMIVHFKHQQFTQTVSGETECFKIHDT